MGKGRPSIIWYTVGWQICVGKVDLLHVSWQNLSVLKEYHTVKKYKYKVAKGIDHGPELNGWLKPVLNGNEHIIDMAKKWNTWYTKKTHKFVL